MKNHFDLKSVLIVLSVLLLAVACTPGSAVSSTTNRLMVSPLPTVAVAGSQPVVPSKTQAAAPAVTPPTAVGKIFSGAGETMVNVRNGPGTTYERIGSLPAGVEVQVTGRSPNRDWLRVSAAGMEGWVFSSFVIVDGNTLAVPCVSGATGDCGTADVPIGNDQAIANIRAMFDPQDLSLSFLEETNNPNADMRKSLIYMDEQGGEYWVDQRTLQVVQWIAGQTENLGEVKTIAALRMLAKTFAMRQSPTFRQKSSLLTITESTKDGKQYAFRWEDRPASGHVMPPFLLIVIRTDGYIQSYFNTLDVLVR